MRNMISVPGIVTSYGTIHPSSVFTANPWAGFSVDMPGSSSPATVLIIIVAAFNMVSALIMMVTDKTREIAILKSMGSTSTSVAWVFQVVGLCIGGVGTVLGIGIGLTTCWALSRYGYHLDPKVYLIDRLPISVQWKEVALVAAITMLVAMVSSLFPALKASALRPVEGLRYD